MMWRNLFVRRDVAVVWAGESMSWKEVKGPYC